MVRTKNPSTKRDVGKMERSGTPPSSTFTSVNSSCSITPKSSASTSRLSVAENRISKRKSVPQKKTVKEPKSSNKSYYMMRAFRGPETISKNIYKEIKRLQSSVHQLIPKLPFSRLVREIMSQYNSQGDLRIQSSALEALQEAAELHLVDLFAACNIVAAHARRKTIQRNDMAVCRVLMNWKR